MTEMLRDSLEEALTQKTGVKVVVKNLRDLSGGCINRALKAETSAGDFFIKYNKIKELAIYETEAKGLQLLREAKVVHVPEVYSYGFSGNYIFLILEFIVSAPPGKAYWENLGLALASLHKNSNAQYGLAFDNYIGSLPQDNTYTDNWVDFFIEKRLLPQLQLAVNSGKIHTGMVQSFHNLFLLLPQLLPTEKPSLLHGDLWSGNVMVNSQGEAALIDPAVYYGHREAELAFTRLFGGFDESFYEGYQAGFPLNPEWEGRVDLYNLYPLMVHVNLFGGAYLNAVQSILRKFS